jgi:hypothetical protein
MYVIPSSNFPGKVSQTITALVRLLLNIIMPSETEPRIATKHHLLQFFLNQTRFYTATSFEPDGFDCNFI